MNWNEYFMRYAYLAASKSKDPSTRIGAVTVNDKQVLSTGYNGICRGVQDPVDYEVDNIDREPLEARVIAPEKYFWFEHAERNAVYSAAREGIKIRDSVMYTQAIPCSDCCRAIIQSGISRLIVHKEWMDIWNRMLGDKWAESQERSKQMLSEARVPVVEYSENLNIRALIKGSIYTV